MTQKKVFQRVETTIETTPRELWSTSTKVSYALLECPRLRGIVRQHMIKRGVGLNNLEDVISEIAIVMQMKMLDKLEKTGDVYFVIYRVSQLVVSNYGKKSINTNHSDEVSLSSLMNDDDNDSEALERLTTESAVTDVASANELRIDLDIAKRRFAEKLSLTGWPDEILRERKRLGRPRKDNPLEAVRA